MQLVPSIGFGLFLALLLAGGFTFTIRECMRLSAKAEGQGFASRNLHVESPAISDDNIQEDRRLIA